MILLPCIDACDTLKGSEQFERVPESIEERHITMLVSFPFFFSMNAGAAKQHVQRAFS